jgi:hypothetical protein
MLSMETRCQVMVQDRVFCEHSTTSHISWNNMISLAKYSRKAVHHGVGQFHHPKEVELMTWQWFLSSVMTMNKLAILCNKVQESCYRSLSLSSIIPKQRLTNCAHKEVQFQKQSLHRNSKYGLMQMSICTYPSINVLYVLNCTTKVTCKKSHAMHK